MYIVKTQQERTRFAQVVRRFKESSDVVDLVLHDDYLYVNVYADNSFVVIYDDDFDQDGARLGIVRVSSDTQAEKGYGISRQLEQIRTFANDKDYVLCSIGFDLGISGDNHKELIDRCNGNVKPKDFFKDVRPALHFTLSQLNEHNKILACEPSRLWRENDMTGSMIRFLIMCAGSDLEFAESPKITLYETNSTVHLSNMILYNIADFDRRTLVKRMYDGRKRKAATGKNVTGKFAFGYQGNRLGEQWVYEPEAEIVRDIFAYHEEQIPNKEIADILNSENKLKRGGKQWIQQDIYRIINNPLYHGWRIYGDTKTFMENLVIV